MFHASFVPLSVLLAVTSSLGAPVTSDLISLSRRVGSNSFAAGAVYFQTNEDKNLIMAANINQDGTLNLANGVPTQGRGGRGTTNPANQPDALFSQGSVKVSASRRILAAVNAGSNTISTFTINPIDPTAIKLLGVPVSAGGDFPVSLAFNSAGNRLCVLNGGSNAGVNCYNVDAKIGLSAIPNSLRTLPLNQTTPPTGPPHTASHVLFSQDGSKLIASIKGTPGAQTVFGFLAIWQVNQDGSLSSQPQMVAPPSGGVLPFGMALIPGKNAALVTDPAVGAVVFDLGALGKVGNATASGSNVLKIDGQTATCWASHSEKTKNFYLTDIATAKVTEVAVGDNLKASVVKQYTQQAGSAPIDTEVVTIGNKDFLYILAANATQIQAMSLDAPGQAKPIQNLDMAAIAKGAHIRLSNRIQGMAAFVKPK